MIWSFAPHNLSVKNSLRMDSQTIFTTKSCSLTEKIIQKT